MFRNLEPYPEYLAQIDIGRPAVPTEWSRRRIKTLLREVDRRSTTGTERLLSLRASQGLVDHLGAGGKAIAAEALIGYKVVRPGDLVMNRMRAASGVFGLAESSGLVSPDYALFRRIGSGDPDYLLALLRSVPVAAEMRRRSRGMGTGESGFLRLYTDAFGAMQIPWPTTGDQAAIVKYLGHAHTRMDRAIAAKRKLIALLEEQKQAVVNQAVTRGLDPTIPMKDSETPWLGSIPAHWQVVELKRMLRSLTDCEHKTAPYSQGSEFHVVRTTAVRHGALNWAGTYPTSHSAYVEWTQRATPSAGDVIFTREAPAGEACVVPEGKAVCLGQRTVLMKVNRDLYDAAFLVHQVSAGGPREQIRIATQGSTVGHLNMDDIGWMRIPVPPLSEQRQIIEQLAVRTAGIDQAIDRARVEVGLLREFRTRLTSDVVTGQLDVRANAADLSELIECGGAGTGRDEDELLDDLSDVLEEADA